MIKIVEFQEATYEYVSVNELMTHVATMRDAGYMMVAVNHISLRAVYRKNLP